MPLQNRVTPFGEFIATHDRGMLMGNRGCLHDANKTLGKSRWRTRSWVTCSLSFNGRTREIMRPGHYTELFFLDEPTALAAGHRPCWECRRASYKAFLQCWNSAIARSATAADLDQQLHMERVGHQGQKKTARSLVGDLPEGTMVALQAKAYLKWNGRLFPWSSSGYGNPMVLPDDQELDVLTPASSVAALRQGYSLLVHPSASQA